MAKALKKISLLESAKAAVKEQGGPRNWLDELLASKSPHLTEVLDLIEDWSSGRKQYTSGHSRSSLARFFTTLAFCNRKENGMVDLLRRCENGQTKPADYR